MSNAQSPSFDRALWSGLAALLVLSACGGCHATAEAPAAPVARADVALEPILWARSDVAYESFRSEPLRALHAELATQLGEPLLFRVVPVVGQDVASGSSILRGETLEIFYQEPRVSAWALRRHVDQIVRRVQAAFPDLDGNDHLLIDARLPEGKTVADLDRRVKDSCGSRNNVRTDVRPASYKPGRLEELAFVLCDGPVELDARLQDPGWPLNQENWRSDDVPQ
jgi:hypothetical protein